MKFTKLYTGADNKSYFEDIDAGVGTDEILGQYSKEYSAKHFMFRDTVAGAFFDWHTAPRKQYLVYLTGEVEVVASGGEKRLFKAGDVLLAADLTGEGHTSRILTSGKSLVIVAAD